MVQRSLKLIVSLVFFSLLFSSCRPSAPAEEVVTEEGVIDTAQLVRLSDINFHVNVEEKKIHASLNEPAYGHRGLFDMVAGILRHESTRALVLENHVYPQAKLMLYSATYYTDSIVPPSVEKYLLGTGGYNYEVAVWVSTDEINALEALFRKDYLPLADKSIAAQNAYSDAKEVYWKTQYCPSHKIIERQRAYKKAIQGGAEMGAKLPEPVDEEWERERSDIEFKATKNGREQMQNASSAYSKSAIYTNNVYFRFTAKGTIPDMTWIDTGRGGTRKG